MGLIKLVILLDQPVYYAGQMISGRLLVEVDKPMSMRGIYLKYSGEASVHWTETHSRNKERYTVNYSSSEAYLQLQQLVFGSGAVDCELAEGEHVFHFNFQLPLSLPSSFEGMYGRIRYSVKATIKRSWKFDHVARQPLTVVSVFDLNRLPMAMVPIEEQTSKTFWGKSGQLYMRVNLPIRGFVPGQIMPIRVSLNNETDVQVKTLCVTLEQNVVFHATSKSRAVHSHVFQNEFPVPEGFGCEEVPLNLQLPALPPSYLEFCRIIDLNYQLKVTARVNGWYRRNLTKRTDLIIGNIPVMSYQIPIPVHHESLRKPIDEDNPSYSQAPDGQPPTYGFVVPAEMTYEDLPPPTYEQSMKIGISERENLELDPDGDGEVPEYSPWYPVYKFENSQGSPKKSED